MTNEDPDFDGETYERPEDHERLTKQLDRVRDVMADGQWRTLGEIASAIGGAPEASVSARLRDLRKDKFGGWAVERRPRGARSDGLFEYRLRKAPAYQNTGYPIQPAPPPAPKLTKTAAGEWLSDLMDLVNAAGDAGIPIGAGVYEIERYLAARK